MGVIKGICISEKRGTAKHEIEEAILAKDWGIQGDAHAGHWHRRVSLLSYEKIEEFRKKGADIELGAFGENLIVSGYDFRNLAVGTRFQCGEAVLEMTQIGKECHSPVRFINGWVNASCPEKVYLPLCYMVVRSEKVTYWKE